jgi:hypothetical protein
MCADAGIRHGTLWQPESYMAHGARCRWRESVLITSLSSPALYVAIATPSLETNSDAR